MAGRREPSPTAAHSVEPQPESPRASAGPAKFVRLRNVVCGSKFRAAWLCHDRNAGTVRMSHVERYQRIAPLYDLLDLPFERWRYRALRPLLFRGLKGHLLDAGIGTGRNCEFYPAEAIVSGIDISPAMLKRARARCPSLAAGGRLYQINVTSLALPTASFDAAVSSFLFCVLPDPLQVPALRELGRVVKPGGLVRLLEYVRPRGRLHRVASHLWQPWIGWANGASFDRETERHGRRPALNSWKACSSSTIS